MENPTTSIWTPVLNQTIAPSTTAYWGLYNASPSSYYGFSLVGTSPSTLTLLTIGSGWQNGPTSADGAVLISITNPGADPVTYNVIGVEISQGQTSSAAVGKMAVTVR
jgi:hypothetical protein